MVSAGELYYHTALWCVYTAKLKLEELRKVYFEMKEKVFKKPSKLLSTACDTDALETLLKKVFGLENKMDSCSKPKCVQN